MFKRILALFLTVMTLCAVLTGACAESEIENALEWSADSLLTLLLYKDNVTLEGHAEFALDGEHFKTADMLYIQDEYNSSWDWNLLTPRADGTEREGGWTIVANDDLVYVIEAYTPGVYRTGTTAASRSILRDSVQLDVMTGLLRALAEWGDMALDEGAVTADWDNGMTVRLKLGQDAPALVDLGLNLAAQYLAKRMFGLDYDQIGSVDSQPMSSYITVTQGILGSTRSFNLLEADVTLRSGVDGTFEEASGTASLLLNTEWDGVRTLDVTFSLRASDYDVSAVPDFDPAAYGVTLAEDSVRFD